MEPWSDEELAWALGRLDPVDAPTVRARLRDIDRLLRGVASVLDCGLEYQSRGSEDPGAWRGLEAQLAAPRTISNEDGSTSRGSVDAVVTIERLPQQDERWLVWTYVDQNCNRVRCGQDPHELFREDQETDSALDAVDIAVAQTGRLVDWLQARHDALDYFVHK